MRLFIVLYNKGRYVKMKRNSISDTIVKGDMINMIKIIYGEKGNGKTKDLIELANETESSGIKVFIASNSKRRLNISREVKFIDATDYEVKTALGLLGFIRGMVAANSDINSFFIDDIFDICNEDYTAIMKFFDEIGAYSDKYNLNFVITVSLVLDEMPEFIKKYIE